MPIIHPEVTVLFPDVLTNDGRKLKADDIAIGMPFVIRPPYIEHKPGHLNDSLMEQCEGQLPETTEPVSGGSLWEVPPSAGHLVLTHTIEGDGTYGTVRINRLTADNLQLARFALTYAFQEGLNPMEPGSVSVNFVTTQDQ